MRRSHFFVESSRFFFINQRLVLYQRSCSVGAEKANCFGLKWPAPGSRRQPMRPARSARRAVTAWIMMVPFMRGGTPK